jgi:hypothetical protein
MTTESPFNTLTVSYERCTPLLTVVPPPAINIPGYGEIQDVRRAINNLTDPSEMIMSLMSKLTVALAPIKRYIEMLDAMMAVKGCMQAIPEAILTLSPQPIYDCFENLGKAIAVLLSYIPPMAYVRMGCDIANFAILVVDEIISVFHELDTKATAYLTTYDLAVAQADSELKLTAQCALGELNALGLNMFDLIKAISIAMDVFLDFMLKFYPALKETAKTLKDNMLDLDALKEALENGDQYLPDATKTEEELIAEANELHEAIPLPPLRPLFEALNALRNVGAFIYNLLGPSVGLDPDKVQIETPEFVNF